MSNRYIIALCLVVFVGFMSVTFVHSLPVWCDSPMGKGNWLVSPLCIK